MNKIWIFDAILTAFLIIGIYLLITARRKSSDGISLISAAHPVSDSAEVPEELDINPDSLITGVHDDEGECPTCKGPCKLFRNGKWIGHSAPLHMRIRRP